MEQREAGENRPPKQDSSAKTLLPSYLYGLKVEFMER
jgi:hypothetical protein